MLTRASLELEVEQALVATAVRVLPSLLAQAQALALTMATTTMATTTPVQQELALV